MREIDTRFPRTALIVVAVAAGVVLALAVIFI